MSRAKGTSPHWFLVNSGVTVEEFCGWSTDEFCRNFLLQLPIRPLSVLEASAKNVRAFQVPAAAFLRATHYDDFEQLGLDKWHIRFKVWIELERMLEVRYAEHTDVASHEFASLSWRHWQAIGQFPWQKHKGVRDYRGDYEAKEQEKLRVAALKEMAEMQAKEKRRKEALAKSEALKAKRKAERKRKESERRKKEMEQKLREEKEAAARLKLEEASAKAEAKRREDADARAKAEAKAKAQTADATLRAEGFAAPPLSEVSRREAASQWHALATLSPEKREIEMDKMRWLLAKDESERQSAADDMDAATDKAKTETKSRKERSIQWALEAHSAETDEKQSAEVESEESVSDWGFLRGRERCETAMSMTDLNPAAIEAASIDSQSVEYGSDYTFERAETALSKLGSETGFDDDGSEYRFERAETGFSQVEDDIDDEKDMDAAADKSETETKSREERALKWAEERQSAESDEMQAEESVSEWGTPRRAHERLETGGMPMNFDTATMGSATVEDDSDYTFGRADTGLSQVSAVSSSQYYGGSTPVDDGSMLLENSLLLREDSLLIREDSVFMREDSVILPEDSVMLPEDSVMFSELANEL